MLNVLCGLAWCQVLNGAQSFEFKRVWVSKELEVATEIRVLSISVKFGFFDKHMPLSEVSAPPEWIEDARHLLFEFACRIAGLLELNIFRAKFPSRICQIRIGPKREYSFRQQSVGRHRRLWRKRKNGCATASHDGERPRSHLGRPIAKVANTMSHCDLCPCFRQLDLNLLLQIRARVQGFRRSCKHESITLPSDCNRNIVGIVRARDLGRHPKTVASIDSEDLITAFPGMFRDFMELVLFALKTEKENSWSDLGQNDQLHCVVGDSESFLPSLVFYFFSLYRADSGELLHVFAPPGAVREFTRSRRLHRNCLSGVFNRLVRIGHWCTSRAVAGGNPNNIELDFCRHFGIAPLPLANCESSRCLRPMKRNQ